VDVVIMAGYNKKLGNATVSRYAGRVLNIHPGLLDSQHPPGKYGGQGMYGDYVHEAILADRLAKTATTVHVADRWFDHGPQVMASTVPVRRGDSPDALGSRVYSAGRQIYWRAIRMHLHKLERDEAAPRPARFLA
jgi:phosphoribosylglycinamide formyltransferase-1